MQGLLFWLFQRGLNIISGSVGDIEAVMVLALVWVHYKTGQD